MILVVKSCQHKQQQKTASLARCFLFGFIVSIILICGGCESSIKRSMFVLSGPIMGTDYRITVIADRKINQEALEQDLQAVMNLVNDSMSHYDAASELTKINQADAGQKIMLSDQLNEVLTEAVSVSELSGGAFDITLGPLIDLWGFGAQGLITQKPSTKEIQRLSKIVGYSRLNLKEGVLIKSHSDIQLNLSAIAKGFAVDQVAAELVQQGIQDYLIDIGGELRASGVNMDSQLWRVGIERPMLLGGVQQVIKLSNQSVATSGDYLNFLTIDGQRFSHTIDPITMKPVLHRLASVTVVEESASRADALATAIMAMGDDRGFEFAEKHQLAAYFVLRDETGDGFQIRYTSNMDVYFSE